jgi:hypothetical protein
MLQNFGIYGIAFLTIQFNYAKCVKYATGGRRNVHRIFYRTTGMAENFSENVELLMGESC